MEWRGGFGYMYVYMYVVPQVAEEDEGVHEKAIEYLSISDEYEAHSLHSSHSSP